MVKSCDLQIARPVLTFSRAASKKTDCEKIVKKKEVREMIISSFIVSKLNWNLQAFLLEGGKLDSTEKTPRA